MKSYDPDVFRWNLHLLDVCSISNAGSLSSLTQYGQDQSQVECVREGYVEAEPPNVENDEVIAQALQEELSRLARQEASETSTSGMEQLQESVLSQDWRSPSNRLCNPNNDCEGGYEVLAGSSREHEEEDNDGISCYSPEENSYREDDTVDTLHISDESELDGEVEKRLNQMVPVPHVPKVNGELPSADEEVSDHQRLLDRLQLYELVENRIKGDGNCQFRAISDQLYRSSEYHTFVREEIVNQLKSHPETYDGYVPLAYADYLKKMSKSGEWGDHVTLQAAADSYGVKIFVITSFKDTCYIEIIPHVQKSKRVIFLSFWAEVHYNSIYPEGELSVPETRKKKWWMF